MPVYEYHCPNCSIKWEVKRTDYNPEAFIICPYCGVKADRVFSTFSFAFSPYLKELKEGRMVDY